VSAAERAQWLAELAQVLDEAQKLVGRLVIAEGCRSEALDLSARLEAARAEVQSLRRSRASEHSGNFDPKWSKHLLWDHAGPKRDA